MEFKNKSDYTAICFGSFGVFKMEYVADPKSLVKWLDNSYKYKDWKYVNFYARRSGRYLGRVYKGGNVPDRMR